MSVYPKAVKPGDTVGLVLPSSMIDENKLNEVIRAVSQDVHCSTDGHAQQRKTKFDS